MDCSAEIAREPASPIPNAYRAVPMVHLRLYFYVKLYAEKQSR